MCVHREREREGEREGEIEYTSEDFTLLFYLIHSFLGKLGKYCIIYSLVCLNRIDCQIR